MASTLLASRNQESCGHQAFMGETPNFSNHNLRHLNPNQKPKSTKKRHFPNSAVNGRIYNYNSHAADLGGVVASLAVSDDAYSFNQRPIETGFNHVAYVTYNVAASSRSEINELRKKLAADLERIRNLNDRIQVVDLNHISSNGKFKKLPGNKRMASSMPFGSNNKESKHVRQGSVNGKGGADENLFKMCRQALTKLMKHKLSWVFNKPVDAIALGLHDYHQIIRRPMDLGSVKLNLSKKLYSNPFDFASDVRLVFENAMFYNPKTDEVHGMADQLLSHFERLFSPIQSKLATHNHVNEFYAVDEFDASSWDDIQIPDRSKKLKTSGPVVVPTISNKQNHSTTLNSTVAPAVQSPARSSSPMQVTEPIVPSSAATRGTVGKLPKPRAKDPNKREMNIEEKQKLGLGLQSMPPEKMPQLLQIIRKRNDQLAQEGDEIELDIEALDTETLWELDRYVANWKKHVSKTKRQALLVTNVSNDIPDIDIDDVPLSEKIDRLKKNKKEAGEEDVDIGDEILESSFPHVEIEKDDVGGPGQVTVYGNENAIASSSSSGSSSSSSGDSSSSSDSDSISSSGSESDADDAQS